jgi:hypothetical protein
MGQALDRHLHINRHWWIKVLCGLLLLLLLPAPPHAKADGWMPSVYFDVYMPAQIAVVYYRQGIQDLIVLVNFENLNSDTIGWVLPLPNNPQIDRESEQLLEIFYELSSLTTDDLPILSDGDGGAGKPAGGNSGVDVLQQERVGLYEVSVLNAVHSQELLDWLDTNAFRTPEGAAAVFQDYIDRGWVFVCAKLADSLPPYGILHPLRFTFQTEQPVFPMQLTAFSSQVTDLLVYSLAEEERTFPNATIEWAYWVPKETLSHRYPNLNRLVEDDVFISKIRRTYFQSESDYSDLILTIAPERQGVEVWPFSGDIRVGESHTFRARGGTPPYTWRCGDDGIGEIDSQTGVFTAQRLGRCKIMVTDAQGRTGQSGNVHVKSEDDVFFSCFIETTQP